VQAELDSWPFKTLIDGQCPYPLVLLVAAAVVQTAAASWQHMSVPCVVKTCFKHLSADVLLASSTHPSSRSASPTDQQSTKSRSCMEGKTHSNLCSLNILGKRAGGDSNPRPRD
jgi:hypothetical protein